MERMWQHLYGTVLPANVSRQVAEWVHILAQAKICDLQLRWQRAAICNPELVEPHLGIKKMWQHSCGTVLPEIHVITCQGCLGMDPHFGSGLICAMQLW